MRVGRLTYDVVLFSTVAFKTLDISQGIVATLLTCGGIFSDSTITSFQIFAWFWQWNNFENRSIFGKVKANKKWCQFLSHPVHSWPVLIIPIR